MTLEELVGQKLVFGIEGARASAEAIELFRSTHAGGLILFERNFESTEGIKRLIQDLETAIGRRLLVLVDHEGGRVIRFKSGVTIFPDAQALGVGGRVDRARQQGEVEAEELLSLGVDVNLAPVLDVLTDKWNPVIGTRSYGQDPEIVAEMGRSRIVGMQSKGISACAKHYPGLGGVERDPHLELPFVSKNWKAVKQTDLPPFLKAFEAKVDCVMSSHVVYPEIDPLKPATFSSKIMHDHLRIEAGYSGVVLTDDLKMGAVSKTVSLREAVPLSVKAGHDLLLVCFDPRAQRETFDTLLWAYKKKDLKSSELEESVERISRLKSKHKERFTKKTADCEKKGKELARLIARGGVQVFQDEKNLLPLSQAWCNQHSVYVLFPDLSGIGQERLIESELMDAKSFLRKTFSRWGIQRDSVELISPDPNVMERERIKGLVKGRDLVLFFCWDAHHFGGSRELLKMLQETGNRLVAVLLREPNDLAWIHPQATCVTAYGYRVCQIEAAMDKLFSTV